MNGLTDRQDGFGHGIQDFQRNGRSEAEIVERDDGYINVSGGPKFYFAEFADWPAYEREAIALAQGKALDVGCGAGRVALHLQGLGMSVVGIDNSPLAVKTCRMRGLEKARVLPFERVSPRLGAFDTVVMYGNNFGLFGGLQRGRVLLRRLHRMTGADGRILAESRDPYQTEEPFHRAYHRLNRRRGRLGGQLRIRIRYKGYATPWMDYVLASKEEMARILEGTGWRAARFFDGGGGRYAALIEKEP